MDELPFTGFPLDPADHLRSDEKWLAQALTNKQSRFILYQKDRPLMDVSDGLRVGYACAGDIADISEKTWIFLGLAGEVAHFAVEARGDGKYIDLRSIGEQGAGRGMLALLARGKTLLDWHRRHQFCACCGAPTDVVGGGYVRRCATCKTEHFPRTDPVVIMMVVRGDKCILGRSAHFPAGSYSALAGFMEPGESIEEAVRREVREEVGVEVGNVSYIKSQHWPFPSSLMIGVMAEGLSEDITLDTKELEAARWVSKDEVREAIKSGGDDNFRVPSKIAIARHLLETWANQED